MLRDAPLGTTTGARWRVTAWRKEPQRIGSSVVEVRSPNDFAARYSAAELHEWKRHVRQHTELQCRVCGKWLRIVDKANTDRVVSAHMRTKKCAEQSARRDLVWQGFIPGYCDRDLKSERALALDARRCPDGVWVSLERQVREWRLSHDRNPLEPGPVSWAALEDDGDELRTLAMTWTHHLCIEDTYSLHSRADVRAFFMNLWCQYLADTRPHVARSWKMQGDTPLAVLFGKYPIFPNEALYEEFQGILTDATIKGVVFVGRKFDVQPGAGFTYRAIKSSHEEQLYKKLNDFLLRPIAPPP